MKNIIYILLLFSLASCKCPQLIEQSDSVRVEYREKIITRIDTVEVEIQLPSEVKEVIKEDSSYLSTSIATSRAVILPDGMLFHTLKNKAIKYRDTVYVTNETIRVDSVYFEQEVRTVVEEVEKKLSWMQRILIKIGLIAMIGAAIYVGVRIYRLK